VNPLAHEEIQELLGAYALHAVEPEEAEQIARHLEQCPRCRSEVSGHREVATLLGNSGGDAPDGLWDRIASQLEEAPPPLRLSIPPPSSAEVVPVAPRRRERSGRVVLAAVGAAAAIVIGVLGAQVVRQDSRIGELEAALDGSSMSDASVATLSSPDGSVSAEVVVLANGTAYLLARDLPGLAPDHTYQLWGVTSHGAVSLGLLGAEPGAVMPFQVGDAEQMSALAVTEEVAGGVERSEHQPVLVGELG
jgi:anti-sigma factor RsiW